MVECRWKCAMFQRRHLAEHEAECLDRVIPCEQCHMQVTFREMKRHLQVCTMVLTVCPNGCGASVRKALLPQHDTQCELKVIACPFASHGCKKHAMRKDMGGHVTAEAGAHTLLLSAALEEKDRTIARLEKNLATKDELKKTTATVQWKIENARRYVERVGSATLVFPCCISPRALRAFFLLTSLVRLSVHSNFSHLMLHSVCAHFVLRMHACTRPHTYPPTHRHTHTAFTLSHALARALAV